MDLILLKQKIKVSIFDFDDVLIFLRKYFNEIKRLNKIYTLTHFSFDLGFGNNNTVTQYLQKSRTLTQNCSVQICEKLGFTSQETDYFLLLSEQLRSHDVNRIDVIRKKTLDIRVKKTKTPQKGMRFFKNWFTSAVFESFSLFPQGASMEELLETFLPDLKKNQLEEALELLLELDCVEKIESKEGLRYKRIKQHFTLGDAVPGGAIISFHHQMINLAKQSIEFIPWEQREIQGLTFCIQESNFAELSEDIRKFRDYIQTKSELTSNPDCVYQVNFQLFPLAKMKKKQQ